MLNPAHPINQAAMTKGPNMGAAELTTEASGFAAEPVLRTPQIVRVTQNPKTKFPTTHANFVLLSVILLMRRKQAYIKREGTNFLKKAGV